MNEVSRKGKPMCTGKNQRMRDERTSADVARADVFEELAKPKARGRTVNTSFSPARRNPDKEYWQEREGLHLDDSRRGKN